MTCQKVTWLSRRAFSTVSYQPAKFAGDRSCGSADIPFFTWPRNQKIKWLWRWGFPTVSYHSANFDGHRYCGSANTRLYICYVSPWSQGRVTWWMLSPTISHHLFNFGGFRSYGKEDVIFPFPISIHIPISMFANDQLLAWTKCIWVILHF